MSSYRSYTPWKSSLGTSYKSGSSSAYSSRDDVSAARYGSLASPSTYRPSFSGGTYRIKRDPAPPPPVASSYVSRYGHAPAAATASTKDEAAKHAPSKYGSHLSAAKDSPALKRYGATSTSTSTPSAARYGRSREPSPAALERTNLRGRSRDPSPALDAKSKLGYGAASYRMATPRSTTSATATSGYGSRYGSGAAASRASSVSTSTMPDKSISYLSVSDFRARSISRAREAGDRKSHEPEAEAEDEAKPCKETTTTKEAEGQGDVEDEKKKSKSKSEEKKESEESGEEQEEEEEEEEEETFVPVAVVTRATSPTPPGATTVQRTRRIDIAKTIEKTLQRSTRRRRTAEVGLQSDRMDDPTRYSRFGLSSRVASYSPHSEGRYSSSGAGSGLRYSASPLCTTSSSTSSSRSPASDAAVKASTSTSPSSAAASRREGSSGVAEAKAAKSKLSPPKSVRLGSRQASVENLAAVKTLPPTAPKADSPTKSVGSSSAKLPNKDFRKSALNVGPTDRPRKSRTPSTGAESDGAATRQERSPSVCSEGSNASASASATGGKRGGEAKLRQRCHPKAGSLGRSASGRTSAHKSCAPAAPTSSSSSSSAATCSSSGAESAGEGQKPSAKPKKAGGKKKTTAVAAAAKGRGSDASTSTSLSISTPTSDAEGPRLASEDRNSRDSQPPAAAEVGAESPQRSKSKSDPTTTTTTSATHSPREETARPPPADPKETVPEGGRERAAGRLQRLSSVSNFFASRRGDSGSEPIFLESSESSGEVEAPPASAASRGLRRSLTADFDTNGSPAIEATAATTTTTSTSITTPTPTSASKTTSESKKTSASKENSALKTNSASKTPSKTTSKSNSASAASPAAAGTKTPASTSTSASASASTTTTTASSANPATATDSTSSTISTRDFYTRLESSSDPSGSDPRNNHNPPCSPRSSGSQPSSSASNNSSCPSRGHSEADDTASTSAPLPTMGSGSRSGSGTGTEQEQEEPSWWQDTSRQIDTASALDLHQKDSAAAAPAHRLRHVDSGEVAWWLRSDDDHDDDTLADDDLKTLDQEGEEAEEASEATQSAEGTSGSGAKQRWWVSEDDEEQDRDRDLVRSESHGHEPDRTLPRSRLTPETSWWETEPGEAAPASASASPCRPEATATIATKSTTPTSSSTPTRLNGSIQVKICRVESGERPWWLEEDGSSNSNSNSNSNNNATVEATVKLPPSVAHAHAQQLERSSSSSSAHNLSGEKHWWMSGPSKKLFNVRRVDSGEKPWWQQQSQQPKDDDSRAAETVTVTVTAQSVRRSDSGEPAWWLRQDDDEDRTEDRAEERALGGGDEDEEVQRIINRSGSNNYSNNNNNNNNSAIGTYSNGTFGSPATRNRAAPMADNSDGDYDEVEDDVDRERPPPLGHRASPDGLEDPARHRKSPYENIPMPMSRVQPQPHHQHKQQQQQQHQQQAVGDLHQHHPSHQQFYHQQQKLGIATGHNGSTNYNNAYNSNNYNSNNSNNSSNHYASKQSREKLFISRHKNIDELLGGSCRPLSPLYFEGGSRSFSPAAAAAAAAAMTTATTTPLSALTTTLATAGTLGQNQLLEEITPDQVRIHDSTAQMPVIQRMESTVGRDDWDFNGGGRSAVPAPAPRLPTPRFSDQRALDDAAIQVYKDGDYGAYLDLESSLAEQAEEIEGLNSSRKNSLVVRTQLSVRVHAIIEKLLSAEGSDLRRALFSLKQVFQEDKDLVHAFVALGGLNCLVRVGNGADQNYQNYILRALGQVMLYVDGMNGVMKHEPTMQWLYSLIASKYRSVVKTALKLLLVFVEYVETNCYLLVNAIHVVDKAQGTLPWSNIMRLLKDYDNADAELVIYATSLINKTLAGLTDQDSFYDESDLLEQQGMEGVIQRYVSKPGTDIDLLDQLQLYEAVLKFEDGEADGIRLPDNSVRKTQRYRQNGNDTVERRKSRRHSTGTSSTGAKVIPSPKRATPMHGVLDEDSSGSTNSIELSNGNGSANGNGNGVGAFQDRKLNRDSVGVTPGLRRRRERAERHKSFLKEQQEAAANGLFAALEKREEMETEQEPDNEDRKLLLQLQRDHTVKDLTQKLSNIPTSPTHAESLQNRIVGDMSGLISKAKEGLAKSKSKGEISRSSSVDQEIKKPEPKKSENDLHWEELVRNMSRPLNLCDLDFTDLNSEDEKDMLAPRGLGGGIPPPPPPIGGPPPMMPSHIVCPPPMSSLANLMPPPMFSYGGQGPPSLTNSYNGSVNGDAGNTSTIKKNKKTVKLFWKEVREDLIPVAVGKTIWDELPPANVDTQKLEHLFESRAKDLMTKKQQELNKSKEIIVLDHKRSNAINIAMTKLPPPRAIKAAILKMDATVVTREGIDKLLNMLPTDEERGKIQEAQMANPELPLGSAEQFLLTLASISELGARLKLWAFRLDFDNSEKEIAEPLMDLKQGIEILRKNRTFKCILSTLLSVGIFLNGAPVKGFQIEYLAKVPEVKDTVHKHSLLHHLCHMVMETDPETTDLYSEIGPITRASKADFADLAHNLTQLETECKASGDRLKLIAKHDCPPQLKQKLVDFLADCAERIIILQIVHRRVINRYRKFLLWLGVPQHSVAESKPNEFCRVLSEFALEYRTTRERVQQQIEKKANHRERNKTRGKMIIDIGKFKTKEDRADAELKELLGTPSPNTVDGTLTWRRRRVENLRSPIARQSEENFTDGDDEILESLVKTATKAPGTRTTPRERKRTRNADRKSLKRSRTREGFTVERAPSP